MRRGLPLAVVGAALVSLALTSASASASALFSNPTPITLDPTSAGSPDPSTINVQGQPGRVVDVAVTLHKVTHKALAATDLILVSPDGDRSIVLSDVCAGTPVSKNTWVFSAKATQSMPSEGPCDELLYKPTDIDRSPDTDAWPPDVPPDPYPANFDTFMGGSPNGQWKLYSRNNAVSDSGKIEGGWSLSIDTAVPQAVVPVRQFADGVADPYPLRQSVSGRLGVITDINVSLTGIYHSAPDELEMMLVGPQGQQVVLMSDACGGSAIRNASFAWDDEAVRRMTPLESCADGRYQPSNQGDDESFPSPAPFHPVGAPNKLDGFDLTDPNGEWQLYVYDDDLLSARRGLFTESFKLDIETRPKAQVGFSAGSVDVTEGQTRDVTIKRTGPAALGAGTVRVASSPLSATSGTDYTPIATTVTFAAGETQKTVPVTALADEASEGSETLALTLTEASGDVELVTPPTSVVTIRDPAASAPAPTPTPTPTPTPGTNAPAPGRGDVVPGIGGGTATADAPGGGPSVDSGAPVVGRVTLAPAAFAVGGAKTAVAAARRGTTIAYTLSEPAAVTLQVQRAKPGRRGRVGYVKAGTLRRTGTAGANRVAFSGRIGRRALRPGSYRLTVTAIDAAGNRSTAQRRAFRVVG